MRPLTTINPPRPFMTAGDAVRAAFGVDAQIERLAGALTKARNFIAELQHPSDREAAELLAEIDRALAADAPLPAAPPELLAALKGLLAHARPSNWDEVDAAYPVETAAERDAWLAADAAIARYEPATPALAQAAE